MKETIEVEAVVRTAVPLILRVEFDPESDQPEYFEVVEASCPLSICPKQVQDSLVGDFDEVGRIEDEILEHIRVQKEVG